ncbi:MAG: serine/threonine protein kinase [Actinobacteria bacterium]|nr:serine/threonine protein kinase [Actinomycetota bacterium]
MPTPTTAPRRIADRYLLGEELGRGGIGIVWRAKDELLRREVAVKEISFPKTVSEADAESLRTRAVREARAAAGINHPGVVGVYDILQHDDRAFIVMELIEAPTLADLVKDGGPLSPSRAAEIGLQILETLRGAHDKGIVHRDVKPANVMIPAIGRARLADFGIASLQSDPRLTASGIILGSPAYMAPEQAHEGTSSPATDLWGLGATLFFAVCGAPPFDKGQAIPTLTAVLSEEPQISENAGALGPVIQALLEKDPANRPSVLEAEAMLTRVAAGEAGSSATAAATAVAAPPTVPPTLLSSTQVDDPPARREATPERPTGLPHEDRGKGLLIGLGVLALLGMIALLLTLGGGDDPSSDRGPGRGAEDSAQGGGGGGKKDAPRDDPTTEEPVAADGLVTYTDPATGYVVGVPEGWTTTPRASNRTDFVSPTGAYLRTEWTDTPGDDVLGTLEGIYDDFAASYEGYEEIAIESVEYQDYEAAQAEYTYTDGDMTLHAINLQFVTGEYGFALNFQANADEWDELLPTFDAIKASFQAP